MQQIECAEGKITELTTNVIAESMYSQCYADGNEYLLLDLSVDFCKDNKAIFPMEQQIHTWDRAVTHKITAEWQCCSHWKDGSTLWDKLCQLEESTLVQTAEFPVAQGIDHKPAFYWWIKHMLKKRD